MAATIELAEVIGFQRRPKEVLEVFSVRLQDGRVWETNHADWEAVSRFGCARNAVVIDQHGQPLNERDAKKRGDIIAYGVIGGVAHVAFFSGRLGEIIGKNDPAVIRVYAPKHPWRDLNPTFVEVDLERIKEIRPIRAKVLYWAKYCPAMDIFRRIGKHMGVTARGFHLIMIFFAEHRQFFVR